jgi:lipoprotein-anchoring transpeptidase ErfK/SrfK
MFGSVVRRFVPLFWASFFLIAGVGAASANVEAVVNISTQRIYVSVDGDRYAVWKVSTARRGYYTPRGSFRPRLLKVMHYSSKYENSPMPYSVFFYGGYAIHGTGYVSRLGSPASHGCVRLHTANAANFFYLIKRYGRGNTRIRIVD